MLAGRIENATDYLPEALVDRYAIAGSPAECAAAMALRPHFDLFMLPLNDEAKAEDHIRVSAGILRFGGNRPPPSIGGGPSPSPLRRPDKPVLVTFDHL